MQRHRLHGIPFEGDVMTRAGDEMLVARERHWFQRKRWGFSPKISAAPARNRSVSVGEMAIVKLCVPGGASVGAPPRLGPSAEAHFALYDFDWLEQ